MYDLAVENNKFLHVAPRDLKKKDIDKKMRPICDRIVGLYFLARDILVVVKKVVCHI
jgi:hypothetical protein